MATPAATPAELHALLERFESAINRRAYDELDDMLVEDFTRHSEATPGLVVASREDFKDFLKADSASFPDNVQRFVEVAVEGDRIGVVATYEGTHQGPLGPFPATGKRASFDFAGMFTVRDGKLASFRVTWDNMTIMGQLGLLPAEG